MVHPAVVRQMPSCGMSQSTHAGLRTSTGYGPETSADYGCLSQKYQKIHYSNFKIRPKKKYATLSEYKKYPHILQGLRVRTASASPRFGQLMTIQLFPLVRVGGFRRHCLLSQPATTLLAIRQRRHGSGNWRDPRPVLPTRRKFRRIDSNCCHN
ncbi:unnamed protein product [Nesidiocoris tenuis]|uniref:Uncharacterized protein n=1 Tax=Nesidiocoris tenuis TaxID=355587 RepID=A0A6H5GVN5_9HEMI|nr:unnamed protein product [Nesidiocoris tenuis]